MSRSVVFHSRHDPVRPDVWRIPEEAIQGSVMLRYNRPPFVATSNATVYTAMLTRILPSLEFSLKFPRMIQYSISIPQLYTAHAPIHNYIYPHIDPHSYTAHQSTFIYTAHAPIHIYIHSTCTNPHLYIQHMHQPTIITELDCTGLHWTAIICNALHWTALECNALQCTGMYCSGLQWAAKHCKWLHWTALDCNALQCSALDCTGLQCSAMHRTILHWTALDCNALQNLYIFIYKYRN